VDVWRNSHNPGNTNVCPIHEHGIKSLRDNTKEGKPGLEPVSTVWKGVRSLGATVTTPAKWIFVLVMEVE
jgi:hypothetical protein